MRRVSICVLTHNRAQQVLKTINNLKMQFGNRLEVLVLNNGSTDETGAVLREFSNAEKHIHVYESSINLGVSAGRAYLWRRAQSPYILSMDDDILLSESDLESMISCAAGRKNVGVVSPNIKDSVSGRVINETKIEALPTFYEACFLISKEVVERVGSFDSRLMYAGEGLDYALRMRKVGLEVFRDTKATVIHYDRVRTDVDWVKRRQQWLWSFCFVYWKNLSLMQATYWSLRNFSAHIKTGFLQYGARFVASLPRFVLQGSVAGFRSRGS